jgi:hypothetical protein
MDLQEKIEINIQAQKFYDELIEVSNRLIELSKSSNNEYDMKKALKRIEFLKTKQSELISNEAILQSEMNDHITKIR